MATNHRIRLNSRPVGMPTAENFLHDEVPVESPGEGQVLLRTLYLSLDPYMRGRMSDAKSYARPTEIGEVMVGATVSEVVESRSPEFSPGDIVLGYGGWQEYSIEDASQLRRLDPEIAPVSTALGVLGMPGFTAYAGLLEIGMPKPGETVVVAAATGPVGSVVGQIAKIVGARAVGIAGGPDKVAHLKELGFDVALDHRSPNFRQELAEAVPEGIDVYFENVGGKVFEAVLPLLNTFARVPVCGLVSSYNLTELPPGPDRTGLLMSTILRQSLTVRGFIQSEFVDRLGEQFLSDMRSWIQEGKIRYREDIRTGLDRAPEYFNELLTGGNFGKMVVAVGEQSQR
ncbi:NADP-dependent oxidoreductase [Brevibacterium casei]|uniref:Enoyl reductase (ER) domain-containing protein n=3 Tax=Brevibacterium casei TaxID=33889 RepID=A0A2H1HPH7_9MICO|nr:NADP-dependent oxidoreductase [Brevibacterium casei]MCT1551586.1 NADP-dependent oxidoreductase [Brevibacterium casei]MCT1561971.1 NADP-dependent oxidoreductase [Brevibacterium casei]MCT2208843.1 NADP-dependent oxidoreductase [Brevibacterium casei]MDH5148340.1 NADP-dependent oxidoreductase [Brevibacterium casei]QPR38544.1 NADP-dependent oxidoreductase [Brevibacterium casei]